MPGSPTLTVRLSAETIEKLAQKGEKAAIAREYIIAGLQGGNSDLAGDCLWLIKFFNNGGSKQNIAPEELEKIKQIYTRAKTCQKTK